MAENIDKTHTETGIDELVHIVHSHINPVSPMSTFSSTRTHTSPLMGTSARAAKRRIDSDSGPIRIEGTDIYNQQLQHHYQNVRQILEDQQQPQISNIDTSGDGRESFNSKLEFFEQRFKTPPPTYDIPPRQQGQKIITTITTTTTTPSANDRTSSSSNESPSVDRVLEQAVELQKLSNNNSTKNDTQAPLVIERTEQYQVILDSSNHEIRRTPSVSRTTIVPVTKVGHATDLDQAQAQVERLTDDHQAIQNLTRVLQEHNITTINEYKRLPSQTNTNISTMPTTVFNDRTNFSPIKSDYSVIDALLSNPLGITDEKSNNLINIRYNDIVTNLRNPEYLNSLKQTVSTKESKKMKPKEKKPKETKLTKTSTETVRHSIQTPLVGTSESEVKQKLEPTTSTSVSEQTPLIDPKEKKKQDKENKKQTKTKTKSKEKTDKEDFQVIDAVIGSPLSIRLPDSYLTKYKVSPPLTQTNVNLPSVSNEKILLETEKDQTIYHLIKIVSELQLHNAAALTAATRITPNVDTKQPAATATASTRITPNVDTKQPATTTTTVNEIAYQQPLVENQRLKMTSNQTEIRPQSEPMQPRVIYRYMDEQGRILKISSTPPSQLHEQPAQPYSYRNTDPLLINERQIISDDERRHLLPQYEHRPTWQGEPKLPTTVTREDFELRDKRVPFITDQSRMASRTIPVTIDHERPPTSPTQSQQQRAHNIKLAWLPLSYQSEQQFVPTGTAGYDTDSTISERSATYRPYEYVPADNYHHQTTRPLINEYYYNRSSGPTYYSSPPPPPSATYGGRGISPEFGNLSRNYLEVFRGGDFRETKPSEIYSLPLSEHIRTSPIYPSSNRHSRYDQYQSERYGTISNRPNIPSTQQTNYYSTTLPNTRYQQNIPTSNVYTTSYYTHRTPYQYRTVQNSPHSDYSNYIRQSKSFDYRPLRTKLQREYKITPSLLVDEWDYPVKYSTTTSTTNRSGLSSPDDVFITNPINKI